MSYIGNTVQTQGFVPAIDTFSGNGSTTAFTLSRPVASVAQVECTISNVPQDPNAAYTVSGNTITFTSAPPSGTNNIYVRYTSLITQTIAPSQGTVGTAQLGTITNIASGNSPLTLQTGTSPTTAVTIDTSQNVGIGTSSPTQKLSVNGNAIILGGNTLYFTGTANTNAMYIKAPDNTGALTFSPNGTEAVRIDSSGNLLVNKSSISNAAGFDKGIQVYSANYPWLSLINSYRQYDLYLNGSAGSLNLYDTTAGAVRLVVDNAGRLLIGASSSTGLNTKTEIWYAGGGSQYGMKFAPAADNTTAIAFLNASGTNIGSIAVSTSATTYYTSSDYRLKENIAPMTGALDKVSKLNPVTYKWKIDGSDGQGFIAHELQEIVPDCVVGKKDAVDAEGKPVYQGIDTSFLVATLTAAIQEQQALITDLTTRLAALEAK